MLINGTIQNVVAELSKVNPNYEAEVLKTANGHALVKRYTIDSYFCNGRWNTARGQDIGEVIKHLKGVSGKPNRGPGPVSCGRVSCSSSSAMYWCNDESLLLALLWRIVSNGTRFLTCVISNRILAPSAPSAILLLVRSISTTSVTSGYPMAHGYTEVAGQVFYKDKWNAVVRSDSC